MAICHKKELAMEIICANCMYYVQEYYRDEEGKMRRHEIGLCNRKVLRKKPSETCKYFKTGRFLPQEELVIRRQELCDELKELTDFLSQIKFLADIVKQIQELLQ